MFFSKNESFSLERPQKSYSISVLQGTNMSKLMTIPQRLVDTLDHPIKNGKNTYNHAIEGLTKKVGNMSKSNGCKPSVFDPALRNGRYSCTKCRHNHFVKSKIGKAHWEYREI